MSDDEIWRIAAEHEHRYSEINIDLIAFAHAIRCATLEEAITILETYQVNVGNSAAGEIACEMTMASLREIRDEIRALAKSEGENNG